MVTLYQDEGWDRLGGVSHQGGLLEEKSLGLRLAACSL